MDFVVLRECGFFLGGTSDVKGTTTAIVLNAIYRRPAEPVHK